MSGRRAPGAGRRSWRVPAARAGKSIAPGPPGRPTLHGLNHSFRSLGRHADSRSSLYGSRRTGRPLGSPVPAVAGPGPARRAAQIDGLGAAAPVRHRRAAARRGHRRTGRDRPLGYAARARGRPHRADGRGHRRRRHHAAPHRGDQLDHGSGPCAAAARAQDRRARLGAHAPGRGGRGRRRLHRRRREDRLVRGGAVAVRGGSHRTGDHLRRPGAVPADARRRGRRRSARHGPGRPAVAAARHPAGRHPAREGGPGDRAGLGHRGRAAGTARHRRRGALPRPLPRGLPGGPQGSRAQRPHVVADLGGPGAAAGRPADHGGLVRGGAGPRRPDPGR